MEHALGPQHVARWFEINEDPNDAAVLEWREAAIKRAMREPVIHRFDALRPLVAGRRVLDLGCVDHMLEALNEASLHGMILATAASVAAADRNAEGLQTLAARGEPIFVVDLDDPATWPDSAGEVDVIVAGELIEHLEHPGQLFAFAARALLPGGLLAITTPNPCAPHRVRSMLRGHHWENVDHLTWVFPGAMVEWGQRYGFDLIEARTTGAGARTSSTSLLAEWRYGLRRRVSLGVRSRRTPKRYLKPHQLSLGETLAAITLGGRRSWWAGETAIYVLQRRPE